MSGELAACLLALACGAAAMLLWDILYGMRRSFVKGAVGDFILDTVWWFVSAYLFLWCMWKTVSLRFRFFEPAALAAGGILYHYTLSGVARRIFYTFFTFFLKIFQLILKILLTPAVFLDKILIEPLRRNMNGKKGTVNEKEKNSEFL